MRKTIQASVLALLLSVSAYAGEMQCGAAPPPPPPSAPAAQVVATIDGEIQTGVADSLTETVLTLLGNVLALI